MAKGKPDHQTEATLEDWLTNLLAQAVESRASDIHIDPGRSAMLIRFRIDGVLYKFQTLEMDHHENIISKVKILGKMDITKHRIPQDGHFSFEHSGRRYNIRISTYPTIFGEDAVLRILNRESSLMPFEEIGYTDEQLKVVRYLVAQPYGMVMMTGPSGSGKTSFIYSMLQYLNKETNNLMAVEDPVELEMDGWRQTQVGQFEEMDFARALRAILRQDPDILMVGEIRDRETAEMSMQAALTGRMVFSTFHTLDMFAVVHRLMEMDIPRSIIAHAFLAIISTRLVRKICPTCKVEYTPTPDELKLLGQSASMSMRLYKGSGCDACLGSGFQKRVGIFEVVPFDLEIRDLIIANPNAIAMDKLLRAKKIPTLAESGLKKVLAGITTVEEVIRVTGKPM